MTAHRTDPAAAAAFIKKERAKHGWSTIQLADYARAIARREGSQTKLTQQTVSGFEQGTAKRMPEWFRYVRMAFEEGEPTAQGDTSPRDELVYIKQVDIRYAMGDGATIDEFPSTQMIPFNLDFIKSLSSASTDKLFIATGFGDSMEPVLHKHDLVLIDTTENRLDIGDTIWALEYADSGYIKRLRSVKRDGERKIMILSANPDYPPELADPSDVRIVGKVVWIARRM